MARRIGPTAPAARNTYIGPTGLPTSAKYRFSGPVVIDMLCLLRLELELSVQAKAMLLARESGLELPVTSDLQDSFREIEYLRASIGRTGLLALKPLQVTSGRDLCHRYLLAS